MLHKLGTRFEPPVLSLLRVKYDPTSQVLFEDFGTLEMYPVSNYFFNDCEIKSARTLLLRLSLQSGKS